MADNSNRPKSAAPTKTMLFLLEVSKKGFVRYEERLTGTDAIQYEYEHRLAEYE